MNHCNPEPKKVLTLEELQRQVNQAVEELHEFSKKHGLPLLSEMPEVLPLGDFEIRRRKV